PRRPPAPGARPRRAAAAAMGAGGGGGEKPAGPPEFGAGWVRPAGLPMELARHESARLADIIARVNKWSINWLADRVIMTAAALVKREPPSMDLALSAMYDWLIRHPGIARSDVVVDTGSRLSYHTRIPPPH